MRPRGANAGLQERNLRDRDGGSWEEFSPLHVMTNSLRGLVRNYWGKKALAQD